MRHFVWFEYYLLEPYWLDMDPNGAMEKNVIFIETVSMLKMRTLLEKINIASCCGAWSQIGLSLGGITFHMLFTYISHGSVTFEELFVAK